MKIFILISLLAAVSTPMKQQTEQQKQTYSVYFEWNRWQIESDTQRATLQKVVEVIAEHPDAAIAIDGWTDRTGTEVVNRNISLRRAESVRKHLIDSGIATERMTFTDHGVDSLATDDSQARRAEITLTFEVEVVAEPAQEPEAVEEPVQPEPEPIVETVAEPEPQPLPIAEPQPEPEPQPKVNQQWLNMFALRTNALYWLGGMLNVGAEWTATPEIGVLLNGGYAPWASNNWRHNWAAWFVSAEGRWYFGEQKSWFGGVQLLGGAYNFKPKDKGVQGSILGGGVVGGYKMPLWRNFDVDFSIGVGFAHLKYDRYRHADNGINVITERGVVKNTVIPLQAGVNLIWNF